MANEVAALVVALSAQLSQFQKDMQSAGGIADTAVKGIEDSFKKINPDASGVMQKFAASAQAPAQAAGASIGLAIGAGITASVGALLVRLSAVVDGLAKIGDKAEDLRLPVNLLQALSVAAESARVPQDKLNTALDKFTEVSKKTRGDAEEFYKALSNIGKGFADAFEKAPTQEARLRIISNALKSTSDEVKKAQLALAAFGTDNERMLQVLGEGGQAIDQARLRLRALGSEIDESAVKKAQQARSDLSLLARVFKDELSSNLAAFIPTLTAIVPLLERMGAAVRDMLAAFTLADQNKPIASLQNEFNTLQGELDRLQEIRDRLASAPKTRVDSLRDELRTIIGLGPLDIEGLDAQIADVKKRMEEIDTMLRDRTKVQPGGPSEPKPTAFKGRPPLTDTGGGTDAFDRQVDSINRHIAALNADAAAVGLTVAAHEQLRTELALLQAIEREGGEVTNKQIDAYAQLRASMSQEQALLAAGIQLNKDHAESFDEVSRRMFAAKSNAEQLTRAYQGMQTAIQFGGNQLIDIFEGLRTKTLSAADAMKQLTNTLIKALLQASLLGQGPLAGIMGLQSATAGGTGGLGGILSSLLSRPGTGFVSGLQHGGPVSAGRPYLVGEHGAELFVPKSSGQVVPGTMQRGGGGTSVEINNFVAADTETKQTRTEGPDGERIIIDIVKKAQSRGEFDAANRGRFALRPAKVR